MIAATTTFAVAATEASTQSGGQSNGPVVIDQLTGFGDIVAGQSLNVTDTGSVQASTSAIANRIDGAVQQEAGQATTAQASQPNVVAETELTLNGDTTGYVVVQTQAHANYLAASASDGALAIDASQSAIQSATGAGVRAATTIDDDDARLLAGANVSTGAYANTIALGGETASVTGSVDQTSQTQVTASTYNAVQYIPAEAAFSAQALGNAVQSNTTANSHQELDVRQSNAPSTIQAEVSTNAGNAWNLAGRANAAANQANLYNSGGSMVVSTDQSNAGRVRSTAVVTAYDYGAATATAHAAGNEVVAGNNDIYLELDNTQLNSGGVEASAAFAGNTGYDAYVGADAVGNSVTGYTCSTCAGVLNATSSQVNNGDVSAVANTTVNGSGRAVVTGANAVGNSATFYVARPGS